MHSLLCAGRYSDQLSHAAVGDVDVPSSPAQSDELQVIEPHKMKLGKGGSLQSRIAILHSLASIELVIWATHHRRVLATLFPSLFFLLLLPLASCLMPHASCLMPHAGVCSMLSTWLGISSLALVM